MGFLLYPPLEGVWQGTEINRGRSKLGAAQAEIP
jgi:hypothetical protein